MEVKFYWSENRGTGRISEADKKRLLNTDWISAADFLRDVIIEAEDLYEAVLEKYHGG